MNGQEFFTTAFAGMTEKRRRKKDAAGRRMMKKVA